MSTNLRPIVVGVDGSTPSVDALRWAVAKGLETGRRVIAFHVWQCGPVGTPSITDHALPRIDPDLHRSAEAAAQQRLAGWIDEFTSEHPDVVHGELVEGAAKFILVRASRTADMLVLGAMRVGPTGRLTELLLGSTTLHVLHHAHCAVVLMTSARRASADSRESRAAAGVGTHLLRGV
jgi:nucleotide-binding universal stress UspA family protein